MKTITFSIFICFKSCLFYKHKMWKLRSLSNASSGVWPKKVKRWNFENFIGLSYPTHLVNHVFVKRCVHKPWFEVKLLFSQFFNKNKSSGSVHWTDLLNLNSSSQGENFPFYKKIIILKYLRAFNLKTQLSKLNFAFNQKLSSEWRVFWTFQLSV